MCARKEDRDRCRAAGIDDYVAKPVGPAALTSIIERLLAAEPALEPWLDPVAILHASQDDEAMFSALTGELEARAMPIVTELRTRIAEEDRTRLGELAGELAAALRAFSATAADQAVELERAAELGNLAEASSLVATLADLVAMLVRRIPTLTIARLRRSMRRARG